MENVNSIKIHILKDFSIFASFFCHSWNDLAIFQSEYPRKMLKISKAYAGLSVGTICPAPITVAKVNPSNCQSIPDMV